MVKRITRLALAGVLLGALAASARAEGDEAGNDQRVRMEALEESVAGLEEKLGHLGKVRADGFVNLRFDDERNPNQSQPGDSNTANNGQSGIYARRAELKFAGKLSPTITFSLGYDFTENKHKDLGIEIVDLPFLPFVDFPDYLWSIKIGQFRMPFGITPQTSSSAIWLPERPIIFGARQNNNTQIAATNLIGERVMGLQFRQKAKLAGVKYDLQGGFFNNATQDQIAGKNKLADAFTSQDNDQDLSFIGRFALDHAYLTSAFEGMLGEKAKIQTGVSYLRDQTNGEYMANDDANISYTEALGAELLIELWKKMLVIQSEYVRRQTGIKAAGGATANNLKEGWYLDTAFNLLPFVSSDIAKGDSLQVIGRLESQSDFAANGGFSRAWTRATGGLKWNYQGGKNHTSLTYIVSAPDMMFGGDLRTAADGGTGIQIPETTIVLQQQFAFGN